MTSCRSRSPPAAAVTGSQATRASSQVALNVLGPHMPEMLGGSADLTGSVNTRRKDSVDLTVDNFKRQLRVLRRRASSA